MKRLRLRRLAATSVLVLIGAGYALAYPESARQQFESANQLYESGDYAKAAEQYRSLSESYSEEGVFFYNLGNSLFRTGKTGEAILAYERARAASPRDPDIRFNLTYTKSLLEYHIDDKRNWYLKVLEDLLNFATRRELFLLVLVLYFIFASAWALKIYFKPGLPWGWRRKTLVYLMLFSLSVFGAKHVQTDIFCGAIVTTDETQGRYGPSMDDRAAFKLGEGLKVYVIARRHGWSRVMLTNGETGWVPSSDITEILGTGTA
ncbi:MAG: hypothetical protein A2Z83_07305 [Omnitrophica bacterium GWA2_52_8]|nr:MAG: hypothetical protein A2Z83_07305 [Omnitrophica bacterium GWA2_52_8]